MPTMQNEPLRLPAWCWGILAIVLPPVIAVLLHQEWRIALATALGGLLVGGGVVGKAESSRAFTDSPTTRAEATGKRAAALDAIADGPVLTDDEPASAPPPPPSDVDQWPDGPLDGPELEGVAA